MLALFQNNRITTVVGVIVYAIALNAGSFAGVVRPVPHAPDVAGALYGPLFGWADQQTVFSAVISTLFVVVQALLLNRLADVFRLAADRSWLPGLLYVWFASCWPEFLFLTPPLVAVTFVIPALRNIFKAYKQPDAAKVIFDAGFWIAVAGLFYPPALWLGVAAYFGLSTIRSFSLREQAVFVVGLFVPVFLVWVGFLWFDQGFAFWSRQFGVPFGLFHFPMVPELRDVFKLVLLAVLLLTVIVNSQRYFRKKLINVQKYISVLYIFLLVAGLGLLVRPEPRPEYALLLAPSMGIFLGMSLQNIRNPLVAELVHLVMFAAVLFIQFWPQ